MNELKDVGSLGETEEQEQMLDKVQGIAHRRISGNRRGMVGKPRPALIYTTSVWQAIAHISGKHTAQEARFPNPWEIFPIRVMRQVDYGIANAGLECNVVEYDDLQGNPLGTILYLRAGSKQVACYAMRYDEKPVAAEGSQEDACSHAVH